MLWNVDLVFDIGTLNALYNTENNNFSKTHLTAFQGHFNTVEPIVYDSRSFETMYFCFGA